MKPKPVSATELADSSAHIGQATEASIETLKIFDPINKLDPVNKLYVDKKAIGYGSLERERSLYAMGDANELGKAYAWITKPSIALTNRSLLSVVDTARTFPAGLN